MYIPPTIEKTELKDLLNEPFFQNALSEVRKMYDLQHPGKPTRVYPPATVLILPELSGHTAKCDTV